jgi:uncharacterized protein (DUF1501 family)
MSEVMRTKDAGASYPATGLAERLRVIARLIKGGGCARVYYTSQGSYDTHYVQLPIQADLLAELSGALRVPGRPGGGEAGGAGGGAVLQ